MSLSTLMLSKLLYFLDFYIFLLNIKLPRLPLFGKRHIGVNEFINPSNFHFRVVSVANSLTPLVVNIFTFSRFHLFGAISQAASVWGEWCWGE